MFYRMWRLQMKPTDFALNLTKYLTVYLPGQRGISRNTIKSYTDTFKLFFVFCKDVSEKKPEKITIKDFDDNIIVQFLDWLENVRGNSIATRNQRLSAIQAFCKFLLYETPENIFMLQKIISIPRKKYVKPQIGYLSMDEVTMLLSKPDRKTSSGRRDLVLLTLLYDSGARVSELINIRVRDIRKDEYPVVTLHGKGGKIRQVPLMKKTAYLISEYINENKLTENESLDAPLFWNSRHEPLTRMGITYILKKYSENQEITPHVMRHTKAMHLLQAGVNIVYIRDILGHSSIETTNIYARADSEMKRKALESINKEIAPNVPDWNSDNALLDWLKSLG